MFFIGGAFLYLAINIYYIFELIPIPGKHQSLKSRMVELKADVALLASEYNAEKAKRVQTLSIAVAMSCLLVINFFYHLIPDSLLIPIIIVSSHFFVKKPIDKNTTTSTLKQI